MAEREEISILSEIERLSQTEAFRPFSIVMASGARYDIVRGDAVAVGRSVVTVIVLQGGQHLLRQSQISELNVPEVTP